MRVGFIDHSFHQKTLSTHFLVDILQKHGVDVEFIWDYSWKGGKPVVLDLLIGKYDAFIFFQNTAASSKPYYKMPANITYVPMLDAYGNEKQLYCYRRTWGQFAGLKVLSFSKYLHHAALSHGLASKYLKYFPKPGGYKAAKSTSNPRGFFWQRRPDQINWDTIKILLGNSEFASFHIHMANDPGQSKVYPTEDDVKKYNINFSEWFQDKSEYHNMISLADVYFAPRRSEGIGMSFLEAMAIGRCVVAPNYGTMNEYILHGINGLLYDLKSPRPLSYENIEEIGRQAQKTIEIGYEEWLRKEEEIVDFILQPRDHAYWQLYPGGCDYSSLADLRQSAKGNCISRLSE